MVIEIALTAMTVSFCGGIAFILQKMNNTVSHAAVAPLPLTHTSSRASSPRSTASYFIENPSDFDRALENQEVFVK
jgi:hypothetical protein